MAVVVLLGDDNLVEVFHRLEGQVEPRHQPKERELADRKRRLA